jgi:hypothetical protein
MKPPLEGYFEKLPLGLGAEEFYREVPSPSQSNREEGQRQRAVKSSHQAVAATIETVGQS